MTPVVEIITENKQNADETKHADAATEKFDTMPFYGMAQLSVLPNAHPIGHSN